VFKAWCLGKHRDFTFTFTLILKEEYGFKVLEKVFELVM
jgi:hypothetical protein